MNYSQNDLAALELELKKNPTEPANYVNLAEAQLALNKNQQAFSTYRAAKLICPDDPVVMTMGAKVFESLGKREEAIECLQNALKTGNKKVNNADIISRLAELLYNSGKKELALRWLKELVDSSDEKPEVLIRVAQIYLSVGNILESQKYLKQYKEKAGSTKEMFSLMGETMLARGFFDGAVKNYTDAVRIYNTDADMHLGLGKAWLGMGEAATALKEFTEAFRLKEDDINILLELGKLQSKMGMADCADETFSKIENTKLQNGECYLDIARHFLNNKNDIRAIKYLEEARLLSPFHTDILKLCGETYLRLRKYDKAFDVFSSAIKADSNAIWAYEGAVTSAGALNLFSEKAEAQKKLLTLKKSSAEDWCDYGETLIRLGLFDESRDAFEEASKIDPACLRAYQAPEIIKQEKSRKEGEELVKKAKEALEKRFYITATDKLEKALTLVPDNPEWTKILANIALKTAKIEKASQLLSFVKAKEPVDFNTDFQLARTYEFLNNLQMAIELLSAITKENPFELRAHLMLLRLKRCQVKGSRITIDMLDSIIRNIESDFGSLKRESPIPLLVKGYAYYIFSYNSSFQTESLKNAEKCFMEVLNTFGESQNVMFALALVERIKGNYGNAVEYMKNYVQLSPNYENYSQLAKMYENINKYDEAVKIYEDLREKYPENGYYRKKYVETTANLQMKNNKNELIMLLSNCHKKIIADKDDIWPIYESAIGQEMSSKKGNLSSEWQKRSLLSWRKAENHPNSNHWVLWEMTRSILENTQGLEKTKFATSLKPMIEKNLREMPDYSGGYVAMARCLLAFNDLTNSDKALDYLLRAWYLDQSSVETGELLAKTAKNLGKSAIVDVVGYNVILSEPEIANYIFKYQ